MKTQKETILSFGDCCRIAKALGLSMGEYVGPGDDARGLAFTVGGGKLIDGRVVPWICRMNGWNVEEIAREAIKQSAVKKVGRWKWEVTTPSPLIPS